MDAAYVICGKLGDILSGVAMAQSQSAHSNIIVSSQYAPQLGRLPGVTLHVYDGAWDDLSGAIKWAKLRFKKVLVPQTFGKDFPIKHSRPSFQLDQAARCGVDWSTVRLNVERTAVVEKRENTILLADHSESSPFPHKDDLNELLQRNFPGYTILKASEITLQRFVDFVDIYDSVSAIVTIDTAHLHLSAATTTPVLAFVWDNPVRWRGSAWHQRFKFYCRYGEYQERKGQFVNALRMALEGRSSPEPLILPMAHENAYNPSLVRFNGNLVRAYRFHPDKKLWPTSIAIDGVPVELPDNLKNHSIDDPRLFVFKEKLHLSYVATPYPVPVKPPAPCVMGYGPLEEVSNKWRLTHHNQPKYGRNDLSGQEKNWVFFDYQNQLHFIYKCSPEQEVVQIQNGHKLYKTMAPTCSFGEMRGGTQPIGYNGQWLRFFHTLVKSHGKEVWWQYYVGALLMEPKPPFQITSVSKHPILAGNERYFPDWKFYKPRVAICYGAVETEGGWIVSVGLNDSRCADVLVKPEHLNL